MAGSLTKVFQDKKLSKVRLIAMIIGSIILSAIYIIYLVYISKTGVDSLENNIKATIVFVIIYFGYIFMVNNMGTSKFKLNKRNIINLAVMFVPFLVSAAVYLIFSNILITLAVFIVAEVIVAIYYQHFVPVFGYNRAYYFFCSQQFDKAKNLLHRILTVYPDNFESLVLLGAIYIRELDYYNAIELLERAKKIEPDEVLSYANLSNAYTATENYAKSIENSKKVLEFDPSSWSSYYTIALCNYLLEEYDEAIEYYREVLDLEMPEVQKMLVHYGLYKSLLNNNEAEEAKKAESRLLEETDEGTINFWQTQLKQIGTFTNKPSQLVKEAVEFVVIQKRPFRKKKKR